ncbi:hypothetical protein Pcac1_g13165 [Phytophthora cactorum]|nr:hypothetical protein Pcac1_g13165 [Phytophthora cactorum]
MWLALWLVVVQELQVASVRWETTVLVAVVFSTKKLLWSAVHEDEVVVRVVAVRLGEWQGP